MVDNLNFISIKEILNRILRHPLLKTVDLEEVLQYTVDFIRILGIPEIYSDKKADVIIDNFRGELPGDLISIKQIRLAHSKMVLSQMTDTFGDRSNCPTFKVHGNTIFTSFQDGCITVAYKSIDIDDDGMPLIPDDPSFMKALELYIKIQVYTDLFDIGKISANVLQNTQQEYAFAVGQCSNKFLIPSESEMQNITNMMGRMLPDKNAFNHGFRDLGKKEIRNY